MVLLHTITELATAINNNPNYAIDIATNLTNINNSLLNRTQQYYFNSGTLSSNSPTYVKIGTLSNIQESVQHIKITITFSETNHISNLQGNMCIIHFKKTLVTQQSFWGDTYGYNFGPLNDVHVIFKQLDRVGIEIGGTDFEIWFLCKQASSQAPAPPAQTQGPPQAPAPPAAQAQPAQNARMRKFSKFVINFDCL